MFDGLDMAPPDAIMGLNEAFKKDPRPEKINLTIGVYKDENGDTPVFHTVKLAEERLLKQEKSKGYLAIEGSPEQAAAVQELLFGGDHPYIRKKVCATAQTPGGTGGLRVAADLIRQIHHGATVWISEPTWPNHPGIFNAAGLNIKHYPYYDAETKTLDFESMMDALKQVNPGDLVLLHGACHNPTGLDPDAEQWAALAKLATQLRFVPFFDFAYQGLGDGIEEDAAGLRAFCTEGREMVIASSFSKNFGLYNERVGALTLVAKSAEAAQAALSHLKSTIRANYSTPPAHGGLIVSAILGDPALKAEWVKEVAAMRERIHKMRQLFVDTLKKKKAKKDFGFLILQKGMFSFSGLTKEQVQRLREDHAVYVVGNGRINVAAMTGANMDPLCTAIAAVLKAG